MEKDRRRSYKLLWASLMQKLSSTLAPGLTSFFGNISFSLARRRDWYGFLRILLVCISAKKSWSDAQSSSAMVCRSLTHIRHVLIWTFRVRVLETTAEEGIFNHVLKRSSKQLWSVVHVESRPRPVQRIQCQAPWHLSQRKDQVRLSAKPSISVNAGGATTWLVLVHKLRL